MRRNAIHVMEEFLIRTLPKDEKLRGMAHFPIEFASMEEYEGMIDDLYNKCMDSFEMWRFWPDIVIGILESGFYPAYVMADKFDVNIDFIKASSNYLRDILYLQHFTYIQNPGSEYGFHRLISLNEKRLKGKDVLIVDNEASSGGALRLVKRVVVGQGARTLSTAILTSYIGAEGDRPHADVNSKVEVFSHSSYKHLPSRRYSPFFRQYREKVEKIHEEFPWMRGMG